MTEPGNSASGATSPLTLLGDRSIEEYRCARPAARTERQGPQERASALVLPPVTRPVPRGRRRASDAEFTACTGVERVALLTDSLRVARPLVRLAPLFPHVQFQGPNRLVPGSRRHDGLDIAD